MAPTYRQLLDMSDDQLIASHDRVAEHTILGVNYYLEELRRRLSERQTERMVGLIASGRRSLA